MRGFFFFFFFFPLTAAPVDHNTSCSVLTFNVFCCWLKHLLTLILMLHRLNVHAWVTRYGHWWENLTCMCMFATNVFTCGQRHISARVYIQQKNVSAAVSDHSLASWWMNGKKKLSKEINKPICLMLWWIKYKEARDLIFYVKTLGLNSVWYKRTFSEWRLALPPWITTSLRLKNFWCAWWRKCIIHRDYRCLCISVSNKLTFRKVLVAEA